MSTGLRVSEQWHVLGVLGLHCKFRLKSTTLTVVGDLAQTRSLVSLSVRYGVIMTVLRNLTQWRGCSLGHFYDESGDLAGN